MKKIGLGIAILLFGILVQLSIWEPLYYFAWIVGVIGLGVAISGYRNREDDSKG